MEVWTLTVDDGSRIATSVHRSEREALDALYLNYDADGQHDRDIQALIDAQGLVIYIDSHEVVSP